MYFQCMFISVPRVDIVGGGEMYVETGSRLVIECDISESVEDPMYVFWWRGDQRVLQFSSSGVQTQVRRVSNSTTRATLILSHVTPELSGNYTCAPAHLPTASVLVNVINGEYTFYLVLSGGRG